MTQENTRQGWAAQENGPAGAGSTETPEMTDERVAKLEAATNMLGSAARSAALAASKASRSEFEATADPEPDPDDDDDDDDDDDGDDEDN